MRSLSLCWVNLPEGGVTCNESRYLTVEQASNLMASIGVIQFMSIFFSKNCKSPAYGNSSVSSFVISVIQLNVCSTFWVK